jgi:hypothetical protein
VTIGDVKHAFWKTFLKILAESIWHEWEDVMEDIEDIIKA